ncbi:uncharacterized protein N7496_003418 [Penicillium cataractarum]|uniref:Uncharacterized protein n=1 Tax=Penicillium cataractarum TaxID=2100454 RepID=A0A9W9SM95_9EURO|nr:uncharacterized protein N7496_003418 [Penicillium cataractarum]KAJ5380990.1 hypothetical protein N7496_003418 [Penicillium cataractarum]
MKPTDSLRHQLLKYLEERANRTSSTPTAPPPYPNTTTPSNPTPIPIPIMYASRNWADYDDDYNHYWEEPTPTATSITIDSSMTITGDKNTVTLSSPRAGSLASETTAPVIETTTVNAGTHVKGVGHGQDQMMGHLASTIINALKAQGLTEEKGRKRPITIELKRGITIKGIDNEVRIGGARSPVKAGFYDDGGEGDTIRSASVVSRGTQSEWGDVEQGAEEDTGVTADECSPPPAKRRHLW